MADIELQLASRFSRNNVHVTPQALARMASILKWDHASRPAPKRARRQRRRGRRVARGGGR